MMKTFDEVSALINEKRLLHIAGAADLLRKLPKGDWIGGSTEYFMSEEGGLVSNNLLFVTEFDKNSFSIRDYETDNINQVASDAYDSGYSILIIPFGTDICMEYTKNAAEYDDMYLKHVVGWATGANVAVMGNPEHPPIAVNGATGTVHTDKAVALHLEVPESKTVKVNILNIFKPDKNSPSIEFPQEGTSVTTCRIDGKEAVFADHIAQNNFDPKLPIIADCFGIGLNVDIFNTENGIVRFGATVFPGVKY